MTSFSSFSPQLCMVESALPWHRLDGACTHERSFAFPTLCAGRIKEGASAARTQPHPTRNYPMETALSCSWPLPQPECRGGGSGHGNGLDDHRTTTGQVSMTAKDVLVAIYALSGLWTVFSSYGLSFSIFELQAWLISFSKGRAAEDTLVRKSRMGGILCDHAHHAQGQGMAAGMSPCVTRYSSFKLEL